MTQETGSGGPKRNLDVNVRTIEDGARIQTIDGATAEVVSNPRDGIWLLVRYLTSPKDPSVEGTEGMLWVDDVADIIGSS